MWGFWTWACQLIMTVFLTITWCKKFEAGSRRNLWRAFLGIFIANYVLLLIGIIMLASSDPADAARASAASFTQEEIRAGFGGRSGGNSNCPKDLAFFCTIGVPPLVASLLFSQAGGMIIIAVLLMVACLCFSCFVGTAMQYWCLGVYGSFVNEGYEEADKVTGMEGGAESS